MHTRTIIKHALGTLALFGAVNSQAALLEFSGDFTAFDAFKTALDGLSFGVETRSEGFEPQINGVDTPWLPAESTALPVVDVPSLGLRWYQTNDINPGFGIAQNGGDTHQGLYAMNLPGITTIPDTNMSYAMETSGFKLVAFGGWFKDNNAGAKPVFTLDDGRVIAAGPLGMEWEFRGFIDDDPNGGFMKVFVTEAETGNEIEWFFTDDVTLAAKSGDFPPPPIPLPAALPLFGSALLGLGFLARRRQKA